MPSMKSGPGPDPFARSKMGHPLGHVVNGKSVVPSGFLCRFCTAAERPPQARSNPEFSILGFQTAPGGNPFSHPSGSSAVGPMASDQSFEPKGAERTSGSLRLGVLGHPFLNHAMLYFQ